MRIVLPSDKKLKSTHVCLNIEIELGYHKLLAHRLYMLNMQDMDVILRIDSLVKHHATI